MDNESLSLIETLKRVKKIFVNKNIRQFVGIILISNIGTTFFSKVSLLVLYEKGLSQELLTNISVICIPLELFISYHLSKSNEKLLHNYLYGFFGLIFTSIGDIILLEYISYLNRFYLIAIILSLKIVKIWLSFMIFIGVCGFFYKISDNKIGATYITALNSINNMASKWPDIFIFSLVDYLGYKIVALLSLLYSICFYLLFEKEIKKLDLADKQQWEIKEIDNELQTSDKEK